MTTATRTTKNVTPPSSHGSAETAVLGLLLIGVDFLMIGLGAVSGSHEDPGTVTCDRQIMQAGDICTRYTNNAPTRTESYDEMRAERRRVVTTASVGPSTPDAAPKGATLCGADLMRYAEVATAAAKRRGRGMVELADLEMVGSADQQLELEAELRAAINADVGRADPGGVGGKLRLEYQPVVGPDGTVLSAEALPSWSHPNHREVTPGEFLSVVQRAGLQRELDRWVLRAVAQEAATWPRGGQRVAVNLAGLLPGDPDFQGWLFSRLLRPDELQRVLRGDGLPTPATVDNIADHQNKRPVWFGEPIPRSDGEVEH